MLQTHPLHFLQPQKILSHLIEAGHQIFHTQGFSRAVLGLSGGVDSSLALYLVTQFLPLRNIFVYLLPGSNHSTTDAETIAHLYNLYPDNIVVAPIEEGIKAEIDRISDFDPSLITNQLRQGNIAARLRMLTLFDQAQAKQALVLGTENYSEKMLGYSTLFGDSASSVELFNHLYKTQIIQLATLIMPVHLALRPPSAELWPNQTDEKELGFSYDAADRVIAAYFNSDFTLNQKQKLLQNIDPETINLVLNRIKTQAFKQKIPFTADQYDANWNITDLSLSQIV